MFTSKPTADFVGNEVEYFAEECMRIESGDVIYSDKQLTVYFSAAELGDPTVFNNQELEEAPLGSLSSYRSKIMVRESLSITHN